MGKEVVAQRSFFDENQEKLLKRFNLSIYHHYNSILNIFENEEKAVDKISNIFNFYHDSIVNIEYNVNIKPVIIGKVFYNHGGSYFDLSYKDNEYAIDLNLKDMYRKKGNRGVIENYVNIKKHGEEYDYTKFFSWDEIYKKITGYEGELPYLPFISSDCVISLVHPVEDTVNNHRPTFFELSTNNAEYSELEGKILTVSGAKNFVIKNNYHSTLNIIDSIEISINNENDNVDKKYFTDPIKALEYLEQLVFE